MTGIVEIDEACITGRRLGNHGRFPRFNRWIFGLYSREQKIALIFLVPNRRRETLLRIIDYFVEDGSIIISDTFAPYVNIRANPRTSAILPNLNNRNLSHFWVNHRLHYVDPQDGRIHINNMENIWNLLRKQVKRNLKEEMIQMYVDNFIFSRFFDVIDKYNIIMNLMFRNEVIGDIEIQKPY